MTKNMTSGNSAKLIFFFAVPLLFANIFQQLYNMVDTIIVGRYISVQALAAVGATGSINFLVIGFVTGLTQGVSILTAQYYGAQCYERLRKSVTISACLYFIIGAIITVISVAGSEALLDLLQTPDTIKPEALLYIRIIFIGMFSIIAFNFFSSILRSLGDSKTPLLALCVACGINIGLDILFIVVLHMGVEGAAYATVAAQLISAVICYIRMKAISELKLSKNDWSYDAILFQRSFRLGMPVAVMNSITAIGVMILQFAVNGYGDIYIAAYSVAAKVQIMLEQLSNTFGFAIAAYVGQNLGANKIERIRTGVRKAVEMLTVANILLGVVVLMFGKSIMAFMVSGEEAEVIAVGYQFLVVFALFLWMLGLLFVYRSSLQAMGDTLFPMVSGFVEFFTRIAFVLILPMFFGFLAVPYAEGGAWTSAGCMLMAAYSYRMHHMIKHKTDSNLQLVSQKL